MECEVCGHAALFQVRAWHSSGIRWESTAGILLTVIRCLLKYLLGNEGPIGLLVKNCGVERGWTYPQEFGGPRHSPFLEGARPGLPTSGPAPTYSAQYHPLRLPLKFKEFRVLQSGRSTNSGQALNFDTSDAGSQNRFNALPRALTPKKQQRTSGKRLPDLVRDEDSVNRSMPSSIHIAPALSGQNSGSHAAQPNQTEALSVCTHCQHGGLSFPLRPKRVTTRGGLVPHERKHPEKNRAVISARARFLRVRPRKGVRHRLVKEQRCWCPSSLWDGTHKSTVNAPGRTTCEHDDTG